MNKKELFKKYWYIVLAIIVIILFVIGMRETVESKRLANNRKAMANKETASGIISELKPQLSQAVEQFIFSEQCIEANSHTGTAVDCSTLPKPKVEVVVSTGSVALPTESNNKSGLIEPKDLFYTTKVSDKCHISQTEQEHYKLGNGGLLATDVACGFQNEVYAPDYLNEVQNYTLRVGYDNLLGNYGELTFGSKKWIIGHLETKLKTGDIVKTGQRIGQTNISGATTGHHSHIELWALIDGKWKNISYSTRSTSIENKRSGKLDTSVKLGKPIYFTSYNLGDVNQNDSSPFIGASGKDLRHVKNPIALTVDMRKLYGIKFGDKIKMNGPCPGIYQVEDEMNIRFRTSCISKQGACIKGDIALNPGEANKCSGVYTISK